MLKVAKNRNRRTNARPVCLSAIAAASLRELETAPHRSNFSTRSRLPPSWRLDDYECPRGEQLPRHSSLPGAVNSARIRPSEAKCRPSGLGAVFRCKLSKSKRRSGDYTDKYVMVDASRPELARFKDIVGQVKTVNMSGKRL